MASEPYRTLEAKPNAASLVKPGELVDLVEVTPLTLADRRIYNLLLENAWDRIAEPVTHVVAKSTLRGSHNGNDRIGESLERLMAAVVRVRVERGGEPAIERVQLLGGNVETLRRDGLLEYEIPARLRAIISHSTVFARIKREVMFALGSKYALTLYEMVQKRANLRWRSSERLSLDALRGVLGVPKGRLTTWSNLNLRAIRPAVDEVNALSDVLVEVEPVRTGRRVSHVDLSWRRREAPAGARAPSDARAPSGAGAPSRVGVPGGAGRPDGAGQEADAEAAPAPAARPAPVPSGLRPRPAWLDREGPALRTATYETARLRHPGYDIYHVEGEWRAWAAGKPPADDPDRAYLAFLRRFAEANPL